MYFYCYVYVFLLLCMFCTAYCFHCVDLSIVCVEMCTVLLPLGVNPIAVNKYIASYLLTPWCRVLLEKLTGL